MKRKATAAASEVRPKTKIKRERTPEPDYCDVEPRKDEEGNILWPADAAAIERARDFLKECASAGKKTLIVPDKDADGLSSGVIIQRTLVALGLTPELIDVHLVGKGSNIHEESERVAMKEKEPGFVIVLDQGSRGGPAVIDSSDVKCLVIDHHLSDEFPEGALVVNACHFPPVPTSALLTYEICKSLNDSILSSCAYLCAIGTHGDLGTTLKWKAPFPVMTETFKTYSKKTINDAVSLLNAPRRTSTFDVITAWKALLTAISPKALLSNPRLLSARSEINAAVEQHTHAAPKFSKDGKIAVLRIHSAAQIHPVIATRWAGHLKSKYLEIVLVANTGYLPGKVNFSCRIARCAKGRDGPPVNIIQSLKAVAALDEGDLRQRLGEGFARGHKEASGGIVSAEVFEELMALLKVGEKPDPIEGDGEKTLKKKVKTLEASPQKNNLMNYFGKG